MRKKSRQNNQCEGPLGIRPGVWCLVMPPVALCALCVLLSSSPDLDPTGYYQEEISAREFSTQSQSRADRAGEDRPRGIRFKPAFHGSSGVTEDGMMFMIEQLVEDRRTWVDEPSSAFR